MQIGASGIPTGATVYYGAMRDYYDGQSVYYYPQDEWDQYKTWMTYGGSCFNDGLHAQFWTVLDNSKTNINTDGMFLASTGLVQASVYWPGDNYASKAGIDLTNNSCKKGSKLAYYRDSVLQPLGENFYNYAFSNAEKSHVIATTKSDDAYSTSYKHPTTGGNATISTEAYPNALQNDHIFSLSVEEVVKYMPKEKDWDALANFDDPSEYAGFQGGDYYLMLLNNYSPSRSVPLGYWLRSPIKPDNTKNPQYPFAVQVSTNYLAPSEIYPQPHVGWRPAMNFDKNGILFSSSVLSKQSGKTGENCLEKQNQDNYEKWGSKYTSGSSTIDASYAFANKWKLTMLDNTRDFDAKLTNVEFKTDNGTAGNPSDSGNKDNSYALLTIDYSGATADKKQLSAPTGRSSNDEVTKRNEYVQAIQNGDINQYVSAVITDQDNKNVLYYGRIKEITNENETSGTVQLRLPENIDLSDKHLYIYSEQANDPVKSAANNGYYQTNESNNQVLVFRRFFDDSAKNDLKKLQSTSVPALDYYTDYASPMIELPVKLDINGTKTWDDYNNAAGDRPGKVTVELLANNEVVKTTEASGPDWSYSFKNLPQYDDDWNKINYTVRDAVPGYESTTVVGNVVNGQKGSNATQTINLTNKRIPKYWNIQGTKTWDDFDNNQQTRPDNLTIHLLADGVEVQSANISAEQNWSYSFDHMPAENSVDGKPITYTISEDPVAGYLFTTKDPVKNNDNGTLQLDIKNTKTSGQWHISGVKNWKDFDNASGIRPESITVHLLADGQEVAQTQATAANQWAYDFGELPSDNAQTGMAINYTVTEDPVNGYSFTADEVKADAGNGTLVLNITNEKIAGKWKVHGQKTWDDKDNADGVRPQSITVRLLADGTEVMNVQTNADKNWLYDFGEQPAENSTGKTISYSVIEDKVDRYTFASKKAITDPVNSDMRLDIVNTYVSKKSAPKTGVKLK